MVVSSLNIALGVLGIITASIVFIYLYFTRNFNYWKILGVPYVQPSVIAGNLGNILFQKRDIARHLQELYLGNKDKPYVGFFSFDIPCLLINDLDLVKNVLVKQFQSFTDRNVNVNSQTDPMFGRFMFSLKGQEWKHVRVHLTPVFSTGKMKGMFHLVEKCAGDLDNFIDDAISKDSNLDVKETMARYTTDSITNCAFGLESNALKNEDSEIRRYLKTFVEYDVIKGVATLFLFFCPYLQNLFKLRFVDIPTTNFLRRTVWGAVDHREKTGLNRKDFIDHMMELRKKNDVSQNGRTFKIEGDTFVAQSFGFFFAGFETSASTLTYTLYELAKHPEIQTRLREEIMDSLAENDNKISYEMLHKMTYLDMVVSETLRKYPVLGFLDRVCVRDYELPAPDGKGTVTIKAGTSIYIPLLGIQMDPEYYPDPEKYDPERFTEENKQNRHNFSYMPFGEGPRICIGMRFGLMQVKTGLVHVLSRYEVAPCKDTPIPMEYDTRSFLISSVGDVPLHFKKLVTV